MNFTLDTEMFKKTQRMIDYMIDCTLATVESYVVKKSMPKNEFKRQCNIAQKGIDFLGRDYEFSSRAREFAKNETAFDFYSRKHREMIESKNQKNN